ncbi:MAG: alcohol dehydrogenase catalytic domain-containing protein [Armatimonadetes bacterium]|nr:alcohol dehydrogenase catalytic domain-containing protein [Armatimonadota bacterium]
MQSARSAAVKSLSLRGAQRRGNLQILLEQCVLRDIDLWKPEPREIWLKVDACGVCGTDVTEALDGRADFEPFGHEVAGTILEMGIAVRGLSVGQKVVIESASACGECPNCKNVRQEL